MEKAIEIKRRAQRCVQNGDLDGALAEYEKLIQIEDSDPYNYVLLADLHFKKGDLSTASERYLSAAGSYERAGLYKNAIAVCKKMMRLSLSPASVLEKLAALHALDGLTTESALYYMQYAEGLVRDDRLEDAAIALRKAFDTCPENVKGLERLAEVYVLLGDKPKSTETWLEASSNYQRAGLLQDADRCRTRADQLQPGSAKAASSSAAEAPAPAPAKLPVRAESSAAAHPHDPGTIELPGDSAHAGPPRLPVSSAPPEALALEADESEAPAETGPPRFEPIPLGEADSDDAREEESADDAVSATIEAEPRVERMLEAKQETAAAGLSRADAEAPGLSFGAPVPHESREEQEASTRRASQVRRVEELLQLAQTQFRAGERDAASHTLVEAAQAYDTLGQHDSAATIYRSLGKSTHAGREVMLLWLQNCELRRDLGEAAQVACELGDRALNDGDEGSARTWFEKAIAFDASNTVAHRRLQRLGGHVGGIAVATPHAGPAAAPAQPVEVGRVEVAVGRGEAVTFDLGSLVAEFQRGVEVQLGGDPQGHYDLGMTYREMGLLEQAIEAFRTSQRHAGFEQRCGEMIGRCLLDQGCFDEAAAEFDTALRVNGASREMAADLKFQLGLAHEAAGRSREAIDAFEEVYGLQPNYPDIAMKIRVLRSGLEGS